MAEKKCFVTLVATENHPYTVPSSAQKVADFINKHNLKISEIAVNIITVQGEVTLAYVHYHSDKKLK